MLQQLKSLLHLGPRYQYKQYCCHKNYDLSYEWGVYTMEGKHLYYIRKMQYRHQYISDVLPAIAYRTLKQAFAYSVEAHMKQEAHENTGQ